MDTNTPTAPAPKPTTPPPAKTDPPAEGAEDVKKPISPFVKRLTENSSDVKKVDLETHQFDDRPLHVRLSEIESQANAKAKAEAEKEVDDAPPGGEATPEPGDAGKPAIAAEPEKPAKKKSRLIKDERPAEPPPVRAADPQPAPAAPPTPEVPPPAKKGADEDPYAGLSDDQKERIQLLEFGEKSNPDAFKGKSDEWRKYYAKETKFRDQNPDALESEIQEFIESNLPKLRDSDVRRLEREMLLDEADKRAEARLKPRISELEKQLENERKAKRAEPVVDKMVQQVTTSLLDKDAEVPGGFEPYFAPLAETIAKKGEAALAEEHPIEGPIFVGTRDAAREYMSLVEGLKTFDPRNPMHVWLADFQSSQEQMILNDPKLNNRGGRKFVGNSEYIALMDKDPSKLNGVYTLAPVDILNALVVNAHQAVDNEFKRLEKAGFKRNVDKQQPAPPVAPAAADPGTDDENHTPPPAGGSRQPGLASTKPSAKKGLFSTVMLGVE